jgi:uncharacterized membrane protein
MIWLVVGLALWSGAHYFKRLAPKARKGMGDAAKAMVAAASIMAVVLMVIGYRMAETTVHWTLPAWAWHINNLLMVVAVLLMPLGRSKSRLNGVIRHPMLTGVVLWAVAHLLVNGDTPSLVLFGGMGLWAIGAMLLINRAVPKWVPPKRGTAAVDLRLVAVSAIAFVAIVGLHLWLGPSPVPGLAL